MNGSRLSILHVIASLAPRYGGPAKVAELCAALGARGHRVEVVSTNIDGPIERDVPLGVPVDRDAYAEHVFPVRQPRATAFSPALARWLHDHVHEFDLVHVHGLYLFPTLAACHVCRRRGVPYVFQPHGGLNAYHRQHHRGRKALYELLFERRNLRLAATIRYDSQHEQREAVDAGFGSGVVVPPGTPLPSEPASDERRGPTVAFLGRLSEKKGLDLLVDAVAEVATRRREVALRIAGPDDEGLGERLRSRAAARGIADRVCIEGLLTGAAKEMLFSEAGAFVLASADESFGASATEAMAYGTPTIITRGVPIHDDVSAADAGVVTERTSAALAEAITALLDQPERAREIGRNGRALVAGRWSWEAVAAQLEDVYREIATSRGGTGVAQAARGTGAASAALDWSDP